MGFIEDKQKAAAYDAAVAQQAAALKAQGANEVLNAQAQDRAMREALAMQEMLKQPGMASALVGPQYAANTAAAEELKRQYIMQQGDDAVRAQYGASVAPTGNVGPSNRQSAYTVDNGVQAGLADEANRRWLAEIQARKMQGQ